MKPERITVMPVQCPRLKELSPAEKFVFDWVADPTALLAEIFEGCMDNPQDLCEVGRVAFGVYAKVDQERREWEED